jgi:cephalosporin hydroxylase
VTAWRSIVGWCDFAPAYAEAVETAAPGATLIEIGCFFGRSTRMLCELAAQANKGLQLFAYDTFNGITVDHITEPHFQKALVKAQAAPGGLEAACRANVGDLLPLITITVKDSLSAAKQHQPDSAWMVWLDDDHRTAHVAQELVAWWPVVAPGGWIGGHDYDWPSVRDAVDPWAVAMNLTVEVVAPRSWRIRKPVSKES